MTDAPKRELPPNWQEQDAIDSYHEAIALAGEQVRAGGTVPAWLRSTRGPADGGGG